MAKDRTAEDFERVLCRVEDNIFSLEDDGDRRDAYAAIRIAAAVMRPGVIEESLEIGLWESSSEAVAAVIRKALTDG